MNSPKPAFDVSEVLAQSALCTGLSTLDVAELAAMAEVKWFAAGDNLVKQHEQSGDIAVIAEGKFIVTGQDGAAINTLTPVSVVGEVAFLDCGPRTATITAAMPSCAIILPEGKLRELINDLPDVGVRLLSSLVLVLCQRMRSVSQNLEALTL